MVRSIYDAKLTSADEAVAGIEDNSNLIISIGASMPPGRSDQAYIAIRVRPYDQSK